MLFRNSKREKIEEVSISMLKVDVDDLQKRVRELEHDLLKQDGYIRSLRGLVNRMRGMENPKEEDIKTSNPTDYLNKL